MPSHFFCQKNKYKILVSGPWFLSWGNDLCLFGGDICQSQCSSPSRAWYKTWLLGNDTFIFFGGIAVIAIIDKFVPSFENPHETPSSEDLDNIQHNHVDKKKADLLRMGMFSALAIAIHNFPEGLATFTGALQDPAVGISIAVAIAIHNIPEGIAVSVPLYYATGSKKQAFKWSFLSGLSEPVGALIGYLILMPFMNDVVFGVLFFASVAGIMVFISLDELLPTAEKYGEHHLAIYGLVAGMAVMALSLLLFV